MFITLKKSERVHETIFLFVLSLLCFALSLFRVYHTHSIMFIFLNWNLFLAFIPWALIQVVLRIPALQQNNPFLFSLLFIWLLFFPNAPYILTDLFHLQRNLDMPIWFDLILVLSFAWTGLLFGFLSLWDLESILAKKMKLRYVRSISIVLLFLGSFGIYLGRYLRWNSWDLLREPLNVVYDISDRIINPWQHPRTWGMTFGMFLFLMMIYWSFRLVAKRNGHYIIGK